MRAASGQVRMCLYQCWELGACFFCFRLRVRTEECIRAWVGVFAGTTS